MSSLLPRRRFLTALGFALPGGALAIEEKEDDTDQPIEWETENLLEGAFHEESGDGGEPDVTLSVRLERLKHDAIVEAADGSRTYRGEKVPDYSNAIYNASTVIRAFTLEWNGRRIHIPKRFWNDLGGFDIQIMKSSRPPFVGKVGLSWEEADGWLRRPRVYLSDEGETILIEWRKAHEGDCHSSVRWIVSKAGTVLRHRVTDLPAG